MLTTVTTLCALSGIRSDKILRPHPSRHVPVKSLLETEWHVFQRADTLICLSQMPRISEDNSEIISIIYFVFKKRKQQQHTSFLIYWGATRSLFTSFLHQQTSFVLHRWPYSPKPWPLINVSLRTVVVCIWMKIINCERKFTNIKVKQIDNIWTVSNLIYHNQVACVKILIY